MRRRERNSWNRYADVCCDRQVLTFEVDFVVGTGRPITVHLRGVPVEPHASMETFCKIAITDITQRKLAEEVIKGF